MLSVTLPATNTLPVGTINDPFFWKSLEGSSLLLVLATRDALATTIADNGIVRCPMV